MSTNQQPRFGTAVVGEQLMAPVMAPVAVADFVEAQPDFAAVATRFGKDPSEIAQYMQPGEVLNGFGRGGSESLAMFLHHPVYGAIVRKICGEELSSVAWDPTATGVMTGPSRKAQLQVDYLKGLPEAAKPYFPAVYDAEIRRNADGSRTLVYDQEMLKGNEVSSFIADEQPSPLVVAHLHHEIMRLLGEKIHTQRVSRNNEDTIDQSYVNKIIGRLELSRRAAPETFGPLLDADHLYINGRPYRNIEELLAFFGRPDIQAMVEPRVHSLVMGDTNTENVMITKPGALREAMRDGGRPDFTYQDIGLRFIDPRAIGYRSEGATTKDDRMYDNKPPHNTVGQYDAVHGEHFNLNVRDHNGVPSIDIRLHDGHPYAMPYKDIERHFAYIMQGWGAGSEEWQQNDPNWLLRFTFMMGTHFAAMPPFHFKKDPNGIVTESTEAQKRPIAIYAEGIKWLNAAHDMINGEMQSLYGVPVGTLRADNRA